MKVYFRDSNGKKRLLSSVLNKEEAMIVIDKFIDDHNFKSYYKRTWADEDGDIWVDVGSYTEFFILESGDENNI